MCNEIEAGGGIGGIAGEPQKNEHMSEIQLNPQGGKRQNTSYDN